MIKSIAQNSGYHQDWQPVLAEVSPLEQKVKILIQPKKAKACVVRISYSAKNEEEKYMSYGKTSTTFIETNKRST